MTAATVVSTAMVSATAAVEAAVTSPTVSTATSAVEFVFTTAATAELSTAVEFVATTAEATTAIAEAAIAATEPVAVTESFSAAEPVTVAEAFKSAEAPAHEERPVEARMRVVEVVPGAGADEHAADEPLGSPVTIGRAPERIIRIEPVRAYRRRIVQSVIRAYTDPNGNLRLGVGCGKH